MHLIVQRLVFVYRSMRVIKNMAENEYARTRVCLIVECEANSEPDTESELSCDDES